MREYCDRRAHNPKVAGSNPDPPPFFLSKISTELQHQQQYDRHSLGKSESPASKNSKDNIIKTLRNSLQQKDMEIRTLKERLQVVYGELE